MSRVIFPIAALTLLACVTQAQSAVVYTAALNGASESPPTGSSATGNAVLTLDGNSLSVNVSFAGLIGGNAQAAHIHCCTPPGTIYLSRLAFRVSPPQRLAPINKPLTSLRPPHIRLHFPPISEVAL